MSESVIADFVGKFNAEITSRGEPVKGRIICSQKRLVLAADSENRLQIPLSSIFDIAVGHVPPDLGDFFDSTVTIAFERDDTRYVAAVEGNNDNIEKFSTVLFKTILNGTEMTIKHPAQRGGRRTDEPFVAARLYLEPMTVTFRNEDRTVDIDLAGVTQFARESRTIGDRTRPVLVVRHMEQGQSLQTLAATNSARKLSILGRYLRLEYGELLTELKDVELTDEKTEVLVAIYSGAEGSEATLASVLDMEPSQASMLLTDLEDEELLASTESGTDLTPKGQIVVANHLDDVN
jgi:helix-turn-helix protein